MRTGRALTLMFVEIEKNKQKEKNTIKKRKKHKAWTKMSLLPPSMSPSKPNPVGEAEQADDR